MIYLEKYFVLFIMNKGPPKYRYQPNEYKYQPNGIWVLKIRALSGVAFCDTIKHIFRHESIVGIPEAHFVPTWLLFRSDTSIVTDPTSIYSCLPVTGIKANTCTFMHLHNITIVTERVRVTQTVFNEPIPIQYG